MNRLLVVVLALAGTTAAFAQQKAPDALGITGKWQMTLEMEIGTSNPVLAFKQDGEKLTGTYTGRYGEYPLAGKILGQKVDFVVTILAEGTETKMNFTGELAVTPTGEVLRGNADLGGMGEATWLAKREKK
jgi:hypothetical protein